MLSSWGPSWACLQARTAPTLPPLLAHHPATARSQRGLAHAREAGAAPLLLLLLLLLVALLAAARAGCWRGAAASSESGAARVPLPSPPPQVRAFYPRHPRTDKLIGMRNW